MTGTRANPAEEARRYTATAIVLHWAIAALIILNLAIGMLSETALGKLFFLHKPVGIIVLALSIVRLLWRAGHPAPPLPATVPAWNRLLARATHWLLYAAMILMPLSGWVFTSAAVKRQPFSFGLFDVPPLPVPRTDAVGDPWYRGHVIGGWILLTLVVFHVAGALKHRFVDRDATLEQMLPGAGPTRA